MKKNILIIITVGAFLCSYGKSEISLNYNPIYKITSSECDNCDELLDEYEAFIDDYIVMLKEATDLSKDPSAMANDPMKAMKLMEDAQKLAEEATSASEKLAEAADDFTSDQAARYAELVNKLASAAQSMY